MPLIRYSFWDMYSIKSAGNKKIPVIRVADASIPKIAAISHLFFLVYKVLNYEYRSVLTFFVYSKNIFTYYSKKQ